MLKDFLLSVWAKTPWYIKWICTIIIVPNVVVNAVIFIIYIVPWYSSDVSARLNTMREVKDVQLKSIIDNQAVQNKAIIDRLDRFDQHQSLILSAILNKAR